MLDAGGGFWLPRALMDTALGGGKVHFTFPPPLYDMGNAIRRLSGGLKKPYGALLSSRCEANRDQAGEEIQETGTNDCAIIPWMPSHFCLACGGCCWQKIRSQIVGAGVVDLQSLCYRKSKKTVGADSQPATLELAMFYVFTYLLIYFPFFFGFLISWCL